MKIALVSVGTELLFGHTVNTNVSYLSRQLNGMGFDVYYHYTVGDNPERLKKAVNHVLKECDIVITTGGLGPTQDDLTKEVLAEMFGCKLVIHQPSMDNITRIFESSTMYKMTENILKQAYVPEGSVVFANDEGTAPGCALEKNGKIAICLPGPPREMKAMFENKVASYLNGFSDGAMYYRFVRTFGIGEPELETRLLEYIDGQTDPTLATYTKEGECYLRVASKRSTPEEAENAVNEMIGRIQAVVGEYIYDTDNRELADVVGQKLIENRISISCAESCTAGMFASRLGDIPGISEVLDRGFVTYSNEAKMSLLGVSGETLEKYGAVSRETAVEMAAGVKKSSGSDVCISVTGVAGPDGGTDEKPVGLVYIGAVYMDRIYCREIRMRNVNRNWNRNFAMLNMFDMVNRLIDNRCEDEYIDKSVQ